MKLKPMEIMNEYSAAFEAANKLSEVPHIYHAGGWYTFKSPGTAPRRYRRREVQAMTERLRERADLQPKPPSMTSTSDAQS